MASPQQHLVHGPPHHLVHGPPHHLVAPLLGAPLTFLAPARRTISTIWAMVVPRTMESSISSTLRPSNTAGMALSLRRTDISRMRWSGMMKVRPTYLGRTSGGAEGSTGVAYGINSDSTSQRADARQTLHLVIEVLHRRPLHHPLINSSSPAGLPPHLRPQHWLRLTLPSKNRPRPQLPLTIQKAPDPSCTQPFTCF
jgi:hypothetical protein